MEEESEPQVDLCVYETTDQVSYAQSLSNSVAALVQFKTRSEEDVIFLKMQIKRLIDAQLRLSKYFEYEFEVEFPVSEE